MKTAILAKTVGVACSLLAAAPALTQGHDDCTQAQPISGLGTFAFDNSAATSAGPSNALCNAFGTTAIDNDVWFEWTTATEGFHELNTCGTTSVDTKVAVYGVSCAGPILACNDDACSSLQSRIGWNVTAGDTYLIRIGTFPTAAGGTGDFTISTIPTVLNPANMHHYQYIPGQSDWNRADQISSSVSHMGDPGHLATVTDAAEDAFVYFTLSGGPLGNSWLGAFQDMTDHI